jgi:hypothetical protein
MMLGGRCCPLFGANACDTVRAATTNDLGALADELVELTEAVDRSADARAQALLDKAIATFQRAEGGFDAAEHAEDFAAVTAEIGRGRYQLSAVRACLNRAAVPEQMQPCFFDPAHGPAERFVAWTPQNGDPRTVPVCAGDAELVEADGQPAPRNVVVGDDVIPYWDAPDYFVPWFSGYFESVEGCAPEDLLAGFPLGEAFAQEPRREERDLVVTREELRDRWLFGSAGDDEEDE